MNINKTIYYILVVVFLLVAHGFAQPVQVILHKPANDAVTAENMWWVDLLNNTQNTYDVYLYAYATESLQGIVFYAYSDTFSLPPGIKRVRSSGSGVHFRNWWVKPDIRVAVIRTGAIPEATYDYHVEVQPNNLGSASGSITVQRPTPPRLISPRDNDSIGSGPLIFNWLPPGNYSGPVSYRIKIVEVIPGQINEEALRSNRAWYEKTGIRTLSFRYPSSARRLETGRRYAWQIKAEFIGASITALPSESRSFIKKLR